jgi:hypothetical protein
MRCRTALRSSLGRMVVGPARMSIALSFFSDRSKVGVTAPTVDIDVDGLTELAVLKDTVI